MLQGFLLVKLNYFTKMGKLFVFVLSILFAQLALGHQEANMFKAAEKLACQIRHNFDNKKLTRSYGSDIEPYQGILVFMDWVDGSAPNVTAWDLLPVSTSGLYRIRNVAANQYLTLWKTNWTTTYYQDYGSLEDYLWRFEEKQENTGFLVHHRTNLCMGEAIITEPPFGENHMPFMNSCTDTFTFECSE